MKHEIALGDVVKVRSEGPLMTVGRLEKDEAYCYWFANDLFASAIIPIEALAFVRKV